LRFALLNIVWFQVISMYIEKEVTIEENKRKTGEVLAKD
jgi:hypothetical protein